MPSYTKLFSSIITSTIWTEDDQTRIVWITMLALADKNGEVQGSIPGLARIAGVPVESCREAIAKLLAPDPDSRTKDLDGRRIEEIDGGWSLINHAKYRAIASREDSKERNAERQRRFKSRQGNAKVTQGNAKVTEANGAVTQDRDIAEAEADTEADNNTLSPTTRARARKEEPLPEILGGEKPKTLTKAGFPEKSTALDYAASQNWPEKSALSWWLHRDSERSTGEARFRDPNWHWWSDLERWVLNDARTGGGSGKGGEKLPRGARTAGGKRTILDYQTADEWTEENLRL